MIVSRRYRCRAHLPCKFNALPPASLLRFLVKNRLVLVVCLLQSMAAYTVNTQDGQIMLQPHSAINRKFEGHKVHVTSELLIEGCLMCKRLGVTEHQSC